LDPTMAEADEARYGGVLVQAELDRARLEAEVTPPAGDPFAGVQAPADLLAAARARLQADLREQAAKLADIDEEIAGKHAEEAVVDAEIAKIDAAMPMVVARVNIRAGALKSGYGNELDYFQQRQELVEMQHERIVDQKKYQEAEAALAALATGRAKTVAEFRSAAYADLARTDREIAETIGQYVKATRQVELQTLRAPVAGIVQDLAVHTLGGVVTPAQQLLRIVPLSGGIEVEVVIANRDVGFIRVAQKAEIKIATFPFTHYGLIHGRVREIAHDSVEEPADSRRRQGTESASETPQGIERSHQLVYTARIALSRTALDIDGKEVALEPGMAITAEIKTGKRRVLDYLLSPLRRYTHDALRER
ncbi:MAG: HlyD family type I secretion periplasmic adaptor subunit, partial [Steroidobacteraceae bacterium]